MIAAPEKPCPICGKPADPKFSPFCSSRCADVDLNRWFAGAYVVPAGEDEEDGEKAAPAARGNPDSDSA
jgi:hypothetical protein